MASWPAGRLALDEEQLVAGARAVDDGGEHRRAVVADRRLERVHIQSKRLDEEVDGAAAGEADREGVVVAVAEGDQARVRRWPAPRAPR